MKASIPIPNDKIEEFCRKYRLQKLSLFGSVLRDDFGEDSDVDVLVEFDRNARVGFFELYDMEQELSAIFGGRKVDVVTPNGLSKYFRNEVLAEADVRYDKA